MEKRKKTGWLIEGILVSLVMAVLFMSCYGLFQSRAKQVEQNPIETEYNIHWLYSNNQLLYRDLYNMENNTQKDYVSLYYSLREPLSSLDPRQYESLEETQGLTEEQQSLYDLYQETKQGLLGVYSYFLELESQFSDLNTAYDYMIRDTRTGKLITNTASAELSPGEYYFYLTFTYDENGNVTIGNTVEGEDSERIRKYANEISRPGSALPSDEGFTGSRFGYIRYEETTNLYTVRSYPVNCEITYAMKRSTWESIQKGELLDRYDSMWYDSYDSFVYAGCGEFYVIFLLIVLLLALFLPLMGKGKPWEESKLLSLPFEAVAVIAMIVLSLGSTVVSIAAAVAFDRLTGQLSGFFVSANAARLSLNLANLLYLVLLFFAAWYVGMNVRLCRSAGIWGYVRKRSLIYRIFPFIKSRCMGFYRELTHIDVTRDARKMILKIVLINAVALFLISSMWVAGFAVTVVYSVLLYFVLKKYVSSLQKKYELLLSATNEIAEGNLNVVIREDLGVFEPFRPQIYKIQKGFKKAVEEEVKSQHMKAELITNVSHDLKTPLTAIITYIGLLKQENITEEQRREYLDTLERKSLRLKVLIEDLFEISKATSKNVTLNIMDVDIMNLVKQAQLELSDKLEAAGLEVRMTFPEEKVILPLDSQKTFRIYENLFGNIAKYALSGTRVYVTGTQSLDTVTIVLKNISAQEIQVNPQELTERFVRGDTSRNTEGSGLGLAIAKSFTELQNGRLHIEVDGDLFKVTTVWKKPQKVTPND